MGRTLIDDRYELRALVGSGGMAEVYLARDMVLDRDVALKLLKARYVEDEEFVERFRRETKSAASLTGPYVVPIFDRGETEAGTYYIAMEYVPGGTLRDRIRTEGALPPRVAAKVGLQAAQALKSAREKGIVHRDVKPDNILFAESGHAKVVDFGKARAAEATTISHVGDILGSVKYVSLEQAAGERVGPESDLCSLGTVLYEIFTGRVPFEIETPADVSAAHEGRPPCRPRELDPEVPEDLHAIVMKLLSRDPPDRYGSAAALLEDLRRVRDGMPPASPSADKIPSPTSNDAPTLVLKPSASEGATGGIASPPRRRTLWIPIFFFAVVVGVIALVGWGLLRTTRPPSVLGALGGKVGGSSRVGERAKGGYHEAEVPTVTDLGKQETRSRLDEAGFRVAVRFQGSSREDADRVLEQSVAGGKQAREGSKIELTVSGGRGVAKVPDLVGLTYSEAEGSWSNRATCWGRERDPERYRARGRYRGAEPEGRDHAGSGILRVTHDQHRAACGDDHRVLERIAFTETSYASALINATVTAFQVARIFGEGEVTTGAAGVLEMVPRTCADRL